MPGGQTIEEVVPLPHPTVSQIMLAVGARFGVTRIDLISQRRARAVARPRQVAMFLALRLTPLSTPNNGKIFGDRDHTTVLHARNQVEKLIGSDPEIRAAVEELTQQFDRGEA